MQIIDAEALMFNIISLLYPKIIIGISIPSYADGNTTGFYIIILINQDEGSY